MCDIILYGLSVCAILFVFFVIYSNFRVLPPSIRIPIAGQRFPKGFLWATGEDAYQHEGGNLNNDWARWEAQSPSPIDNGDRCGRAVDFYNRYMHDFKMAAADHQNAHRIGIEWSRVEPRIGEYDDKAWRRYEDMLRTMKKHGFVSFFNIWHFTLPLWAVELGGWESDEVTARWESFVRECAKRLGRYIDYWSTMIDAQIYALAGYGTGEIPPNVKDMKRAIAVYGRLIHAHAKAYHIIKEHASSDAKGVKRIPKIGMIYFFFDFAPKGIFIDKIIMRQLERIFNWKLLDAVHTGRIDISVLLGPSLKKEDKELKGTLDWIGVNYYTREIVSFNPLKPGMVSRTVYKKYPASDMGWEIYPEGLYHICGEIVKRYPGVPIMIAENGIADSKDDRRPQFILDHLAWVHRMIQEGMPVFGYTYWSLTDNWEWAKGFWPKFGLYRVNRDTLERIETVSARLFRFIAGNNRLPDASECEKFISGKRII